MAKALLREFDVVGATDRYEEFLLMLSDKVGIRHLQYKMSNTGSHEKRRDKLHEDTLRAVTNVRPDQLIQIVQSMFSPVLLF